MIDANDSKYAYYISFLLKEASTLQDFIWVTCDSLNQTEKSLLLEWFCEYGDKQYRYTITETSIRGRLQWKDIAGYEKLYAVTKTGKVWSYRRNKFLSTYSNGHGYPRVELSKNGISKSFLVHRLVAEAYIPNPENLPIVNHIDENKDNCNVENLEWCSVLYNNSYGSRSNQAAKNCRPVYCLELDKTFESQKAAGEAIGVDGKRINDVLRGKCKTTKGYHFCYLEDKHKLSQ